MSDSSDAPEPCFCAICGIPFGDIRFTGDAPEDNGGDNETDWEDFSDKTNMETDSDPNEDQDIGGDRDIDDDDDMDDHVNDENDDGSSSSSEWVPDESGDTLDVDSTFSIDANGYNPDVLSMSDAIWTKILIALGFNSSAKRLTKAYFSGRGHRDSNGRLDVENSTDPNAAGVDFYHKLCYFDATADPVFPVHPPCASLLCHALTGSPDTSQLNKDVLYSVCRNLATEKCHVFDAIQYHEPGLGHVGPRRDGRWESVAGWEHLIACPSETDATVEQVHADLERDFLLPAETRDLSAKAGPDPLSQLPWDLLQQIFELLDNSSFVRLEQALWHVHSHLHANADFWRRRIRNTLPWFSEMQTFLAKPTPGLAQEPKAVFLWAMRVTEPRQGMAGQYMHIANRRRIWHACTQLAERYHALLPNVADEAALVRKKIRDAAWATPLPRIADPVTQERAASHVFWVHKWDDRKVEKVLETFWDGDGSLVGISFGPRGERRLLGLDYGEGSLRCWTAHIPGLDWITKIVFHVPQPNPFSKDAVSCPKGITVHFVHRSPLEIRDCSKKYCERPFRPQMGMTIIGAMGQIGLVSNNPTLVRFGLIQAPTPDSGISRPLKRCSVPPLERFFWSTRSAYPGGRRIWDYPGLKLESFDGDWSQQLASRYCHEDLLPLEVFMWAHTPAELRSLTRISAIVVAKNRGSRKSERSSIVSLRADYAPESGLERRQVRYEDVDGRPLPKDYIRRLKIDGPGGEYVKEVSMVMDPGNPSLQLYTNKRRKKKWLYDRNEEGLWSAIEADEGCAIVGLALSFGYEGCGHTTMGFAAVLTMPLDAAYLG